jgi:four helix bundle protein
MRDHTRLKVCNLADKLALAIYRDTSGFPSTEQFGLQSQMRRSAVSIASNIVEGCARSSQADYARFIEFAYASARELEYQISLSARLRLLRPEYRPFIESLCSEVCKALCGLLRVLKKA